MTARDSQMCLYEINGSSSNITDQRGDTRSSQIVRSYKRRFWMVFLFSTLSMLSGMLFTQYSSMTDVNSCFYGVSVEAVNWTALIVLVGYIVFVFPVSWLMGKTGLRKTIIIGSVFNTISVAVQFATLTFDSFPYVMVAQFFASLSNVFVLAIPPSLAAIWYPSKEVSRACAMGVFGNQLGVALGFVFSSQLVSGGCANKDLVAEGKKNVAIIFTSVNVVILLLIIFTFENEPKHPPSIAQADKKDIQESYFRSALSMARNLQFVLVFIMYGLVCGTYFAVATILNNLILRYYPTADVAVGWMGLLVIVAGLVGSIIAGCILDFTHKFKETSISICLLSFVSYVVFSCLLSVNQIWIQFVSLGILGFFLTSFLPVGFEYGIEVTYPESEITSAGLLNSATMIFGIIITEISSNVLQQNGPNYANAVLGAALLASSIISCFITKNYKRSLKNNEITSTSL